MMASCKLETTMKDVAKKLRAQADMVRESANAMKQLGERGIEISAMTPEVIEDLTYAQDTITSAADRIYVMMGPMIEASERVRGTQCIHAAIDRGWHAAVKDCQCPKCEQARTDAAKAN